MKTVSAREANQHFSRLLRAAAEGEDVVITRRGKPVAKLVPISEEPIDIFGRMAGTITILGDIVGPIDDIEWTGDAENI